MIFHELPWAQSQTAKGESNSGEHPHWYTQWRPFLSYFYEHHHNVYLSSFRSQREMNHNFETIIFSLCFTHKSSYMWAEIATENMPVCCFCTLSGLHSECTSSWQIFLHYEPDIINVFVRLHFCRHALLCSLQLTCSSAFHSTSAGSLKHLYWNRQCDETTKRVRLEVIMLSLARLWSFRGFTEESEVHVRLYNKQRRGHQYWWNTS